MSDDRCRIEFSRTQEARHLVPRLVHPTSDDTVDRKTLEDDFCREIEVDLLRWNPQHLYAPADAHERERLVDGGWHPRHLEHHVRAKAAGRRLHDLFGFFR